MRMGASSLNHLFLTDLHSLPWFINVSESQGPGTILQSFSFNCSSHTPTLELLHVQPPTTFFNPPSLTRWQGTYVGKVGSWAQLGTMGEQGQTLNSQSQRWHRGMEILGPTGHCLLPQMTLSSSARLDALTVNHYELQLRFTCGNHVMEGPLSVDVQRDPGHIQCAGRFASPGEARDSRQGVWAGMT